MRPLTFSNSEVLVIARWMVRTRLLETLCEADPVAAFDEKIKGDFAELVESGAASFAEAAYDHRGRVKVTLHFGDARYEFGAAAEGGRIQVDRRSDYYEA